MTKHSRIQEDKQVVFTASKFEMFWVCAWAIGIIAWYFIWLSGKREVEMLALFIAYKTVLLAAVLTSGNFAYGAKWVSVQPSLGQWSLARYRLLRRAMVTTYSAADVDQIRVSSFVDEEGSDRFVVEVCSRDGSRIHLTGRLIFEDEAKEVAMAFARPLGLAAKIARVHV